MKLAIRLTRAEVIILWVAAALIAAMCLRPPCGDVTPERYKALLALLQKLEEKGLSVMGPTFYIRSGGVNVASLYASELWEAQRELRQIERESRSGYRWLWSFPHRIHFHLLAFQCFTVVFATAVVLFGLRQLRTRRAV